MLTITKGRQIGIPYGQDPKTCPVKALMDWLEVSRIEEGPVFRGVTKYERPSSNRLSDRFVAEIVKKYCALIGKKDTHFSGHSLRSGFATSAAIAGASERAIQKQTGHANLNILRKYTKEAEMFKENAFNKLDL